MNNVKISKDKNQMRKKMKKFNYKNIKKSTIISTLLLILYFSTITLNFCTLQSIISQKNNSFEENANLIKKPQLSAQEINIITPENKTYTDPMNDYYPATYCFESDVVGSFPSYFDDYSLGSCKVEVTAERNGHKRVLWFDDNAYSERADVFNYFNNQTHGTVEYWVLSNDVTDRFYADLNNIDEGIAMRLSLRDDSWRDFSNNIIQKAVGGNMDTPINNQWYHVRIDFECTTGGYMGLGENEWKVWSDGIESVAMALDNNVPNVNSFHWGTSTASTSYDCYIDAIGYSWDPNYNIGDNLKEGLLLSFDTTFTPDWLGYSLDRQSNKTILGNATFSMPLDGSHNIQVFGNDSLGAIYESDIRHFSIYPIAIITPKNKTYTRPMSGYYPATCGFENDKIGGDPLGWTIDEGGGTCNVIASEGNHSKIVELNDISAADYVEMNQTFTGQSYGTIEFWWRIDDPAKSLAISLWNGATWVISLVMDNGIFKYWDSGWQSTGKSTNSNTWYHVRIDFECTTGGYQGLAQYDWHMHLDGMHYGDYNLINSESQIDKFTFATNPAYSNFKGYLDAISYSWDPNYNIGNNLKEGLLLSFDTSFTPDWVGYSLDSQANKTILGNTTFPMPLGASHDIQVFGNDSVGIKYESKIRYFTIYELPKIFINSPIQNDLFESSAPDYNISINAPGLNETWYTLDNGVTNITFTGLTGTINQAEWDKQADGAIRIQFYANDTLGYENFTEVVVIKDTTAPIVSIDIPYENDFFAENSPSFNITIDELSLNITWYTLDNGVTNITFTGLTGIISQTEWDNLNEGPITIRFYANDMFRRINYSEITLNKDITDPVITIHSPSMGEEFEVIPPPYNITVDELNFESMWYTIDGGLNNYSISQITGYIDSTEWNDAPIGAITIRFYVKDKAGNIGYTDVIVQKSSPPPPGEEESEIVLIIIIGFSVGIGAMGSTTVGFVYYKRKKRIFTDEKKPKAEKPAKPRRVKRTRTRKEKRIVEPPLLSCPFCQNVLKGDLKYCVHCGAKLQE